MSEYFLEKNHNRRGGEAQESRGAKRALASRGTVPAGAGRGAREFSLTLAPA